jgi:hypothetical protein
VSLTRRGKAAGSASVIRLDEHRAKYHRPVPPTDAFLLDAQASGRILAEAVKTPCASDDLRILLARMCVSIGMYHGEDPLADTLRVQALELSAAITARER